MSEENETEKYAQPANKVVEACSDVGSTKEHNVEVTITQALPPSEKDNNQCCNVEECYKEDESINHSTLRRLLLRFCQSVYMDRFGVLSAWLFLIQTVIQLVLYYHANDAVNRLVNIVFNADYCLLYVVYLVLYGAMLPNQRPHLVYIGGVALYATGYLCFLLLFALRNASWLYQAGSWLFLVGSVGIVVGVLDGVDCSCRDLMPCKIEAAYVYGGVYFGLGSAVFCWDALQLVPYFEPHLSAVGLGLFVVGRVCFLHGSQTPRCNIWLCDNTQNK